MSFLKCLWRFKGYICAWVIPLLFLPIPFLIPSSEGKCSYVVLVMSFYWFTEAIPISVTSLMPLVLFPLLGIMSSNQTSKAYINGTLMIFLGSLIAATAVEKSNLHKRIALKILLITGTSPKRLLFGLMFTTAFLSMWISNLASSALIVPIINACLDQLKQRRQSKSYEILVDNKEKKFTMDYKKQKKEVNGECSTSIKISDEYESERIIRKAVFLGVCYSANIGGTGTLTGTSTNLVLNAVLKEDPVSFSEWMIFNIPGMFIMIFVTWLIIVTFYLRKSHNLINDEENNQAVYDTIKVEYDELGSVSFHEFSVFILFVVMLSLWFFRDPDFLTGWAHAMDNRTNFIDDSCPALFVVILLFIIPAKPYESTSPALLDWKSTQESVAWGIILLLGGGFAMAEGSQVSGLSAWLSSQLTILEYFSPFVVTIIVCLIAVMLTEVLSNAGTSTILLPVIKTMAIDLNINQLSVMLAVTLCCSYAFMLPVASGPNAIIFESAGIRSKHMLLPGFFLKIVCLSITLFMLNTWGTLVLDLNSFHLNVTQISVENSSVFT